MKHKYMVAMVVEVEDNTVIPLQAWGPFHWLGIMREGLCEPKSIQLHEVQVYKLGENDEIPAKPTAHITDLFDGWPE